LAISAFVEIIPAIRSLNLVWNQTGSSILKPKHVWAIRVQLKLAESHRNLEHFNLAIHSMLRGHDLVKMKVIDLMPLVRSRSAHSMQRTKVTQIYMKTGKLRAVELLLGQTKVHSTVRYLQAEFEDASAIADAI
jgi:hypothetical protein